MIAHLLIFLPSTYSAETAAITAAISNPGVLCDLGGITSATVSSGVDGAAFGGAAFGGASTVIAGSIADIASEERALVVPSK